MFSRRGAGWLAALTAVALAPTAGLAQGKRLGNIADLEKAQRLHQGRFDRLSRAEDQPTKEDEVVADTFAKWHIYRVTWPAIQDPRKRGAMQDVIKDLENHLKYSVKPNEARNQAFLRMWTPKLVACFREVFDPKEFTFKHLENRVSVVNAAQLLPIYAETRQQAFGDYLEELLRDEKQYLVVQLYAVKGLRKYFPVRPPKITDDPNDMALKEKIARDGRRLKTLIAFLERDWKKMPDATEEAVKFVRREAIQTLAAAGAPAMEVQKGGKVEAPAAYTLLRVLSPGKDAMAPAPSLSEKCEAAIGVCQMDAKLIEEYQPEVGVYLVGQFLVDFATEYTKDYPLFKDKETRKVPLLAWRAQANRLEFALKQLQTNTPRASPVQGKLKALLDSSAPILRLIKERSRVDSPTLLRQTVSTLTPPSPLLFRGVKDMQIDLTSPAGE
jgi:hypothetical protein